MATKKSWKEALKTSASKTVNPFELKFNKQKFAVLNKQNVKPQQQQNMAGKPGASRKRAETVRQNTLLKEYKKLGKTSRLVDKRLGKDGDEENETARFALARQRKDKVSYNLSDDDDGDFLTHKGQALSGKNLNDFVDSDSEAAAFQDTADNFGGFQEKEKNKADVMRELISKSKYYKLERQRVKEENEDLRGDLDAQFEKIKRGLLENKRKAGDVEEAEGDFDSAVKQLAFEKRVKAQEEESKKAPEEIERERLEKEFLKREELRKRISGETETVDEEQVELSRKMKMVEKEMAGLLTGMLSSDSLEAANESYKKLIEGLSKSSHRQIILAKICRDRMSMILKAFMKKAPNAVLKKPQTVLLCKLVANVFSTFDFHHIVSTPAHLLGILVLDYSKVKRAGHAVLMLWLSEVLLEYQQVSKRYVPEVFNFLYSLLVALNPDHKVPSCETFLNKKYSFKAVGSLEYSIENIFSAPNEISTVAIKAKAEQVLMKAANIYADNQAFPEIFTPFLGLVCGERTVLEKMITDAKKARAPLALQEHKPIGLPQLEPFIEDFAFDRGDRKRVKAHGQNPQEEIQRLKAAHKKEMRSAERELRKDSAFLARERLKETKAKDAAYKAGIKKIYGSLGNEGSLKK